MPNEVEELSEEGYEELLELTTEPIDKDIISYDGLKSSLRRWFMK